MGAEHHPDEPRHEGGREQNAAVPISETPARATPERYPAVSKDDSVEAPGESRSFDSETGNPEPRQGAGDGGPDPSVNQGHMGPGGDPAEGKR
jgi:hypothetical protein